VEKPGFCRFFQELVPKKPEFWNKLNEQSLFQNFSFERVRSKKYNFEALKNIENFAIFCQL
jgi:hypothetical protein